MKALSQALEPYIAEFLQRVNSADQRSVSIRPALRCVEKRLGVRFKTSFGRGSLAQIPWLACLAPGQLASVEGVFPVLLYRRDLQSLAVADGVSATAATATGHWPRTWPTALTSALPHFVHKKYADSFVYKEYADVPATPRHSTTSSLHSAS